MTNSRKFVPFLGGIDTSKHYKFNFDEYPLKMDVKITDDYLFEQYC